MDKNLTAFLSVARTGNLTKACERLHVTQSSVTKRIANLEVEVGERLFERHRRGMRLTPAGRIFLEHARQIDAEYRHSRERVAALGAAGISVLRVGAGPLFHLRYVAPLFTRLSERYPQLRFELLTDANVRTIPMLLEGTLDVVFGIIEPEALDGSIFVKHMVDVEHGIVMPKSDPAASRERVDPSHFADKSWVVYTDDPATEKTISDYYVPGGNISPNVKVRTTSFTTGLQMVAEGNFVMSAPLQLASNIEAYGLVIRPALKGMKKRGAGLHVRESSMGFAAIQLLLQTLESIESGTT